MTLTRTRKPGVSAAVRSLVFDRDRRCLAALLDKGHDCRDKWGGRTRSDDMLTMTIEHVREEPGGHRFDDVLHLVAMCWAANVVQHWGSSTENRALLNAYLAGVRAAS